MTLFGLPIFVYGGIFLLILLGIQILGGMRIMKMPLRYHKITAWAILLITLIHAVLGILFIRGL